MDESHFDSLVKDLTAQGSRRRALGGLLAGVVGLLDWPGQEAAAHDLKKKCKKKSGEAKKKCLKKAKKHNAAHALETPPGCTPNCAGKACGPNGCGGQCGACTIAGQSCNPEGACVCPIGQEPSGGVCAPRPTCVDAGDLCVHPTSNNCCGGICACANGVDNGGFCNSLIGQCAKSGTGEPCLADSSCMGTSTCVGFVCGVP
jgi:hypothetical protein